MTTTSRIRLLTIVLLALALPATGAAQTTSVTILNSAPVVTDVTLPSASISPTAGATTTTNTTIVVADLNGCNDVARVTAEVLTPAGATHVAASNATYASCAAGTAATYRWSFGMTFHDAPAALSSGYKVRVTVSDAAGATGTNAAGLLVFAYNELSAMQLNRSSFDFGDSVAPGATSDVLDLGVQNVGNVQLDLQLSGTALAHESEAASIAVGNLSYATASNMSGAAPLASSSTTLSGFDLVTGASSSRGLHWQLAVPDGSVQWVPSGAYSGTVTVTGVKG